MKGSGVVDSGLGSSPDSNNGVDEDSLVPLLTVCWRGLRKGARRRVEIVSTLEGRLRDWMAYAVREAECIHSESRILQDSRWQNAEGWLLEARKALELGNQRRLRDLERLGVRVLTPDPGEAFQGDWMEWFRSAATVEVPGLSGPVFREVLRPAVLVYGTLVEAGDAIVGVPEGCDSENSRIASNDAKGAGSGIE